MLRSKVWEELCSLGCNRVITEKILFKILNRHGVSKMDTTVLNIINSIRIILKGYITSGEKIRKIQEYLESIEREAKIKASKGKKKNAKC